MGQPSLVGQLFSILKSKIVNGSNEMYTFDFFVPFSIKGIFLKLQPFFRLAFILPTQFYQ